jgi:hypothetical protein
MMRFRCPNCKNVLEVSKPTEALLCPTCEKWCRIPSPKKAPAEDFEILDVVEVKEEAARSRRPARRAEPEEVLDVVEVPEEPRRSRRDAVTDRVPAKRRREEEVEDVQFEIVEEGEEREERPRKRKRRRKKRRGSNAVAGIDLDWVSPSLILLIVFGVPGLLLCVLAAIFVNPVIGLALLLYLGGTLWFVIIAVEDGWVTALCVIFVPFYSWYYLFNNWERVGLPFVLQLIGYIVLFVASAAAGKKAGGRMELTPPPIIRLAEVRRSVYVSRET